MGDRYDFFYRQKVTEGELDGAFDALEVADRNMVKDLGFTGVASGLAVTQHAGVADLTVDVSVGTAHDPDGQRIRVPIAQTVNLAVDSSSISTAVAGAGNARVVSLFAVFARALSDPRIDGNSNTVYFVRAETYAFRVVMGNEALSGSEVAPALAADAILLADVTRTFGQTQILNAQINAYVPNRRQVYDIGVTTAAVDAQIVAALAASPTIGSPTISGTPVFSATQVNATGNARLKSYFKRDSIDTTNASVADFYTWTILDEAVTHIFLELSVIKSDGSLTAYFARRLKIKRDGGTVTLGTIDQIASDVDIGLGALVVTLDNSGATGRIRVFGLAATNLNWSGDVYRIEHSHA